MNDPQEVFDSMWWVVDRGIDKACDLLPDTPENAAGRQILLNAQAKAGELFQQWLDEGFQA